MGARVASVVLVALAIGCGSSEHRDDAAGIGLDGNRDAHVATGGFGDPCTTHTDCLDGYCVEPAGGAGGQCSRTCQDDCPTGWDCFDVAFPQGQVKLCVPATGRLCNPCADDAECPGGACLALDGSGRCGSRCGSAVDCPSGYGCGPDATGIKTGNFCQPVTASCTCSAELAGAMRSCSTTNPRGTCWGTQTCSASGGWSACTALTAVAETCDGVDNDCNFMIDDGVGGGQPCSKTNSYGSCPGVQICAGTSGFTCSGPTPMPELCNTIDDNCNGSVDEGFAGLGSLCSAGIGACLRFGSVRCTSSGTGTECGATAGAAATEMCNHLDDDCDTFTDETFATLGTSCAAGVGVCTRYGTVVCKADTSGSECSAMPGPSAGADVCNYLDDDCDSVIDNGFRNPVSGLYTGDQNCGACGTDCTTVFPSAPNATGACVVTSVATCGLRCDPGYFDLDAATPDGCEFQLDTGAIYVSGNDLTALDDSSCGLGPTGTGAGNHPCQTIAQGIARAGATSRSRVLVADATYDEPLDVINGKTMLGGYRADTWERHLATTGTILQGVSAAGNHDRTLIGIGITVPTLVEGFVIRGSFNAKPGGNSYAVYLSGSTAALTLRANQIFAGRGGPGAVGTAGLNGLAGANGAPYSANSYDSFKATGPGLCSATNNRAASGGGVRTCPFSDDVGGGNGGGNNCTPVRSTQNSTAASPAIAGQPGGSPGGGAGGAAGARGYDADLVNNTCYLPIQGPNVLPMFGSDGNPGLSGAHATGVAGCTAPGGSVVSGHWAGGAGAIGLIAANGGGGGGGGAGGGSTCTSCMSGSDMLGGHGGGAGTGGCGGLGGGGGGAGGGAFAVFVVGGTAPAITSNTVSLGTGGVGGAGGIGGAGGLGGTGSIGGQVAGFFCTGKGGRGGDGGDGGAGSGGGGGCGGSSFGFYTSGVGTPTYCATNTVSGGAAGPGGNGGYSGGNLGGTGQTGVLSQCTSI